MEGNDVPSVTVHIAPVKPRIEVAPGCKVQKPKVVVPMSVWAEVRTDAQKRRERCSDYQKPTWQMENHDTEWTAEEDRVVLNSDLLDVEIAKVLGRTQRAVYMRRYMLNNKT